MIKILDFPRIRQTEDYNCSVFCVMAVLKYYNINKSYEAIARGVRLNRETGAPPDNVVEYLRLCGLKTEEGKLTEKTLTNCIDSNIPVIIPLQAYADEENPDWINLWDHGHYEVLIGYSDNYFIFEDPSSDKYEYIEKPEFHMRWHDTDGVRKYINYGIIAIGGWLE